MDEIVRTDMPNPETEPELYEHVSQYEVHKALTNLSQV